MTDEPDFLHQFIQELSSALQQEQFAGEIDATKIATKIATRLMQNWSGMQIYIGKKPLLSLRNSQIYREYTEGISINTLARRYQLGVHALYRIIRSQDAAQIAGKQQALHFADLEI